MLHFVETQVDSTPCQRTFNLYISRLIAEAFKGINGEFGNVIEIFDTLSLRECYMILCHLRFLEIELK